MDTSDSPVVLEGWISVLAALKAGYRSIHHIYLQTERYSQQHQLIARLARAAGVPVQRVALAEMQNYVRGHSHGGVIALASERRYQPLATLDKVTINRDDAVNNLFVVMLDGVEDPFNFGQAIRSLYAAGAHGLVVRARQWKGVDGVIARASAGAAEMMPTAVVDSTVEAIAHFRARGLRIACTSNAPAHCSIYEADLRQPIFLVIGGERRGIVHSVMKEADLPLRIPYGGDFQQELDVTSATAILAFEVLRQRAMQTS